MCPDVTAFSTGVVAKGFIEFEVAAATVGALAVAG